MKGGLRDNLRLNQVFDQLGTVEVSSRLNRNPLLFSGQSVPLAFHSRFLYLCLSCIYA